MSVDRICCEGRQLNHQEAIEVHKQLRVHPEVCDDCGIKPCILAEYLYGKLMS